MHTDRAAFMQVLNIGSCITLVEPTVQAVSNTGCKLCGQLAPHAYCAAYGKLSLPAVSLAKPLTALCISMMRSAYALSLMSLRDEEPSVPSAANR